MQTPTLAAGTRRPMNKENDNESQDVATRIQGKTVRSCSACNLRICGRRERPNCCGQVYTAVRSPLGQKSSPRWAVLSHLGPVRGCGSGPIGKPEDRILYAHPNQGF